MNRGFLKGITDGLPICLGYLSVAFAFGIFATESGLSWVEALLVSATNVTSAGQLAGVPIIACGGSLLELAVSQIVINLRYSLLSVSLSQKVDKSVHLFDRFIISFVNTDEIFAVVSGKKGSVSKKYLYGLILTPYFGWSFGTLFGAIAGNILPATVVSALGIAIYSMFVAIVVADMKESSAVTFCVAAAVTLGCLIRSVPVFDSLPEGFVIIVCAVVASAFFALIRPIEMEGETDE